MDRFDIVQGFIDAAGRCRHPADLHALLDETTRSLSFTYFALVHHVDLRHRGLPGTVALWNYPEPWVAEYLERGLATRDPVHLASHRINVGFAWDDLPRLIRVTADHRRVREETRRAGILDGFTVPANIPGEANGSCSFAVGAGRTLPRESLTTAQLVGSFAFHAARALVSRRQRPDAPRPQLSPRQRECVILMARGSSDRDTARALGIAKDTVTEYLEDARHRFEVTARVQLVMRAVWEGEVALSDVIVAPPL